MEGCSTPRDVLKPGGLFLFTAADQVGDGYIEGTMDGVVFRYFASGAESHRDILREHGFTLIDMHADGGQNTYYLATRTVERTAVTNP